MPLSKILPSESGSTVYNKVNDGFDSTDLAHERITTLSDRISGKADATDLADEKTRARAAEDALNGRVDGKAAVATTDALSGRIDTVSARVNDRATTASLAAERQRALDAESGLSDRVDAKAAIATTDTLSGRIDTLSARVTDRATTASLAAERQRALDAESALSDRVDAKASSSTLGTVNTALNGRVDTLSTRIAEYKGSLDVVVTDVTGRQQTLDDELTAIGVMLAPYLDLVGGNPDRPGDSLTLFTSSMQGNPKLRPALTKGSSQDGGELGQVLRITGADTDPVSGYIDIAPRRAYYVRPGRTYMVQHAFARFEDPTDPANNALELRVQNLSASFGQVSNARLGDAYSPSVLNGTFFVDTFIGKAGSPGTPSYIIPPTSRYIVPHFRVYGNGHQTDLANIRVYDVSDALSGGADIASIIARIAKLEVSQSANVIYAADWQQLSSLVGRVVGGGAEVPDTDTGTHTDPVTGVLNTPNAGRYQWSLNPTGWRRVAVSNARAAADFVAAGIPTVPLASAPSLRLAFVDPATSRFALLSAADSAAFIQDIAVPRFYPQEIRDVTVTNISSIALAADEFRRGDISIQIVGPGDIGLRFGGGEAVFGQSGTWLQKAGQWVNHPNPGTGIMTAVARSAEGADPSAAFSVKINIRVQRTIDTVPATPGPADLIFSRWTTPADGRYMTSLRQEIDLLRAAGIYQKVRVWFLPGASRANNMVNLADPTGPLFICNDGANGRTIETQPYRYMKGDGVDQFIDTQRFVEGLGMTLDSHFLGAKIFPGGGVADGSIPAGSSQNYYIQPNRSSTLAGYRSGSGLEVSGTVPPDRWAVLSRFNDAANLSGFYDETKNFTRPRVLAALPSRKLNILANQGSGGPSGCSALPVHGVIAGLGLPDADLVSFIQANKRIQAVLATIAGA